jgi:hypothetical protein
MFRLFAIVVVVGAFGAALYFSGDALEAWESPKPAAEASQAAPAPEKKAKPERRAEPARQPVQHAQPAKKASPSKPSWLVELNAPCRRGKAESDAIQPPSSLQEVPRVLRRVMRMNTRMNRQGTALVRRSGNAKAATQLRRLFDQDETLLQRTLAAAEKGQYNRLPALARSLVAVAKSENGLLQRLGAADCTLSPDELGL